MQPTKVCPNCDNIQCAGCYPKGTKWTVYIPTDDGLIKESLTVVKAQSVSEAQGKAYKKLHDGRLWEWLCGGSKVTHYPEWYGG